MSKVDIFIKSFVLVIIMSFAVFASDDPRIEAELGDGGIINPIKIAVGEEAFNKEIGTGKYRYVGNSKCRLCHRNFFIGRKKDPHDHSMKVLEGTDYEKNPNCLSCHATGFGVPTGFISIEKTPRLSNVQCEGCHGPGNVHIKMAKNKKRNKEKKFVSGGFLAGVDKPKILKNMCIACHTKRWDQAYHNLDDAYNKYKRANPNSKNKKRSTE